uniref:FMN hydroxy acid dehydrogenase domain-containing protein n=1 Tax=Peronospora matthiolae TaxID=2874970 RepID=A0AAV1UZM8_9STRA
MVKVVPGSQGSTPLNVLEFQEFAREYLPKTAYDYYASGADDMVTLRENRRAFQRLVLLPRVLRDMSHLNLRTSILGHEIRSPVCVAPSAMHCMAHPEGERASSRAAAKAETCYVLSTLSTTSLEDVAEAQDGAKSDALRWFQLYVFKDRELTKRLVERAETAGFRAIVLTVDTPRLGHREPDVRNNFQLPPHLTMANFAQVGGTYEHGVQCSHDSGLAHYVSELFDLTLNWHDVKWLKSIATLPVVVKGVLSPEDANLAVEMGCQGILVSNHGARQLDGVAATIDALPAIVQAVDGRAEVYMDGGIRRGTDVFKALALGARAVFLGRPVLFGLAHSGEAGVSSVLRILNEELKHVMLFSGTASLADIGPAYVRRGLTPLPSSL